MTTLPTGRVTKPAARRPRRRASLAAPVGRRFGLWHSGTDCDGTFLAMAQRHRAAHRCPVESRRRVSLPSGGSLSSPVRGGAGVTGSSGRRVSAGLLTLRRSAVEADLARCLQLELGNVSRAANRAGVSLRTAFRYVRSSPTLSALVRDLRSANSAALCQPCHTPAESEQVRDITALPGPATQPDAACYDTPVIPGTPAAPSGSPRRS